MCFHHRFTPTRIRAQKREMFVVRITCTCFKVSVIEQCLRLLQYFSLCLECVFIRSVNPALTSSSISSWSWYFHLNIVFNFWFDWPASNTSSPWRLYHDGVCVSFHYNCYWKTAPLSGVCPENQIHDFWGEIRSRIFLHRVSGFDSHLLVKCSDFRQENRIIYSVFNLGFALVCRSCTVGGHVTWNICSTF